MRRFKNILFVADGSKGERSVLTRAADLAKANKAKLTVFGAVDVENYGSFNAMTNSAMEALHQAQLKGRRKALKSLCEAVKSKRPGLRTAVDVQTGNLARAAIRKVLANHHDLVMKAPEGSSGKIKVLFGSTDQKLMRKCPCPVWLVKPSRKKRFRKILAAVDINPNEPETESLAKQIMSLSTSLAKEDGSELHVLHVWRLAAESKLRGRTIDKAAVDDILQGMQAAYQSDLDRLTRPYAYDNRTVHLIKGRAMDVIPAFVKKREIDLVVIGTIGRVGIPGLLIGNTAERVLNAIDCAVLTLKPEGFETPIQL